MRKGQIFSLDFLVSMILVVLAFGILMQFFEVHAYALKEEQNRTELKKIGETAADLLVSSPAIVCEIVDNQTDPTNPVEVGYLNNCLTRGTGTLQGYSWDNRPADDEKVAYKKFLGLPQTGYECAIDVNPALTIETDCGDITTVPNDKSYYSAKRKVVVYNANYKVPKSELEDCMHGRACNLIEAEATLYVWKEAGP